MRFQVLLVLLALLAIGWGARADEGLLLHYALDEGAGSVAKDRSGNGLDGAVGAVWTDSPSGQAIWFDGTPQGILRVEMPSELRFGTDSWTFSAWLKPKQFTIDSRQNQRRIFNYGLYPDANLVIDLFSTGAPGYYFCYRDESGSIVSTGGSSRVGLSVDEWSHMALVCDRQQGQVTIYVNGYGETSTNIPATAARHLWRCGVAGSSGDRQTSGPDRELCPDPRSMGHGTNGIFEDTDPGFMDAAAEDYRLRPDAALFHTVGFPPIPVQEIGLYESPYRATWPVQTTPLPMPDWRPAPSP
jgi:hypothetical protein